MGYNFIECNREQRYLLPPSMEDWLPEGHLAWFVLDAVEQLDLSAFCGKYREDGRGSAAYEPSMMVSLLLYAYSMGERSSRQIERLCEVDIAFRVISANEKPDYSTVCRFRKGNEKELEGIFISVLRLCAEAGLVKVGVVALDGTKMKANAALSANRTQEHIEEEVKKMLAEAAAKDKEEDEKYGQEKRGDELPEELRGRKSRRERLKECQERLDREAKERAAGQEKKIEERKEAEERGEKKRGRKPKAPNPEAEEKARANVTDPESRIMKTRKGYEQGYNAQAMVTTDQVIVAANVTQQANDVKQLHPMIEEAEKSLKDAGVEGNMEVALADAGYCSDENLRGEKEAGPELLVATKKDWKQRKEMREGLSSDGEIADGAPECSILPASSEPASNAQATMTKREDMVMKLRTDRGKSLYKLRSQTVEPVFGQIKTVRRCDRFMRRGLEAVRSEWKLLCATHNLLKLWRSGLATWN